MARLSHRDGYGFLIAVVLTTTPLLMMTALYAFMSKDGPRGLWVYVLPGAVGAFAAVPASAAALLIGRGSPDRLGHHITCGVLVSLLTLLIFCTLVVPAVAD